MLYGSETELSAGKNTVETREGPGQRLVRANAARKAAGLPVGRPKGVPNKLTALVRAELLGVYEEIGGREGFVKWARSHKTQFYNLLVKATPREREANSLGTGIQIVINDGPREVDVRTIDANPDPE